MTGDIPGDFECARKLDADCFRAGCFMDGVSVRVATADDQRGGAMAARRACFFTSLVRGLALYVSFAIRIVSGTSGMATNSTTNRRATGWRVVRRSAVGSGAACASSGFVPCGCPHRNRLAAASHPGARGITYRIASWTREALLAHEIAHIRRSDYLASILQCVAEAVLFYHPAVWWISEPIRAERELCCDDLAVVASGDILTYAQALTALESLQPSRLAPVLAANGGSLVNRIRRLIEPSPSIENTLPGPGAAWAMTLLWLTGIGVATLHAAQTPVLAPSVVNLDVGKPRAGIMKIHSGGIVILQTLRPAR
jgi:hypothetical protein